MPDVRDGMLRGRRETIDTGSGTRRVNTELPIRTGRGHFVNYYEDLGISTSPELAENIRKEEAEFQTKIKENKQLAEQQRITNSQSAAAIASSQAQLNDAKTKASFNYWAKDNLATVVVQKPGFAEVKSVEVPAGTPGAMKWNGKYYRAQKTGRVSYNASDFGKSEPILVNAGSYKIPKATIGQIPHSGKNYWKGSTYYANANIGGSDYTGDLQRALGQLQGETQKWYEKQTAPARQQLNTAQSNLSAAQLANQSNIGKLERFEANVKLSEEQRQKLWDNAHSNYDKKINNLKEIFGAFKVEKA